MESLAFSPITHLKTYISTYLISHNFKLTKGNNSFTTKLRTGTATFLTMAYILAVNASILLVI